MHWKELKEFVNSLDEKQLEKKVILWREDEVITQIETIELEEDHYIGDKEEGCYTLKEAELELEDVKKKGLRKVYDKGDPILQEEF